MIHWGTCCRWFAIPGTRNITFIYCVLSEEGNTFQRQNVVCLLEGSRTLSILTSSEDNDIWHKASIKWEAQCAITEALLLLVRYSRDRVSITYFLCSVQRSKHIWKTECSLSTRRQIVHFVSARGPTVMGYGTAGLNGGAQQRSHGPSLKIGPIAAINVALVQWRRVGALGTKHTSVCLCVLHEEKKSNLEIKCTFSHWS